MTSMLSVWTVYDHPRDFPGHWVVRCWDITPGNAKMRGDAHTFDTLDAARAYVYRVYPDGFCLARQPDDDPKVFETWV